MKCNSKANKDRISICTRLKTEYNRAWLGVYIDNIQVIARRITANWWS
jgi:hypothetical protein